MLFEGSDNRKQQERAYRNQLKDEFSQKKSRIVTKKSDSYHPQGEAFSLIANIERGQEQRKKKNSQYYDDLRKQIEVERGIKKQAEDELKRKELNQENKIKEEQDRLRQRYDEEIKQEAGKKREKEMQGMPSPPPVKEKPKRKAQVFVERESVDELGKVGLNTDEGMGRRPVLKSHYSSPPQELGNQGPTSLYPNRVQNETFNYLPRNSYKSNYYRQLLGQRRKLDEETHQIAELNRVFNFEKYRQKQESRGLEQLKNLHKMLDDKNVNFLGLQRVQTKPRQEVRQSSQVSGVNREGRVYSHSQKMNRDEWRKLD